MSNNYLCNHVKTFKLNGKSWTCDKREETRHNEPSLQSCFLKNDIRKKNPTTYNTITAKHLNKTSKNYNKYNIVRSKKKTTLSNTHAHTNKKERKKERKDTDIK